MQRLASQPPGRIQTNEIGLSIILSMTTVIADLLGVLEHSKFALNVAFFVRHEYFLHPKSGKLQEVSRESVHIYSSARSTT